MILGRSRIILLFLLLGLASFGSLAAVPKLAEAPSSIQSALLVKLLVLNKAVSQGGDITILVLGSKKVAMSMMSAVGTSIGKSTLKNVTMITDVPDQAPQGPTVFYVGDPKKVTEIAEYCRKHKVQTMTGVPELAGKGVTIIVGILDNKPKILVDLENAKKEGIKFDPTIEKLATSI